MGRLFSSPPALPPIALTLGDPAGVGPEVLLKALEAQRGTERSFIVTGPKGLLAEAADRLNIDLEALSKAMSLRLIESEPIESSLLFSGRDHPETGRAAYEAVELAVKSVQRKEASAVVTAPLSKAALHEAGLGFSGNTEILGHLTGAKSFAMGFVAGEEWRVLLLTTHIPFKQVAGELTEELIVRKVQLADLFLRRDLGLMEPRLALAALNPHAGEDGSMGTEEMSVLRPAVKRLREEGVLIEGPFPADTLFIPERRRRFEMLVCCYHDQGLIPLKMAAFDRAVNVTLGLPIVRTSPDHGTAYDIAGSGTANPGSMIAAIELAEFISQNRTAHPME